MMTETKIHLKPCPDPRCPSDPELFDCCGYFVECNLCGWSGPIHDTPEAAAEAWNRRGNKLPQEWQEVFDNLEKGHRKRYDQMIKLYKKLAERTDQ